MSMTFRPMQWWDVEAVLRIEKSLFTHDPWTAEMFWSELAQVPESRLVWGAESGDEIAGFGSLRYVGNEGDINTIAIDVKFQRRGFGNQLYLCMENAAQERGVRNLFLEVRSDNEPAHTLYVAQGFEQIETRKNYYGDDAHALVMRKRLAHV